MTAWTYTIPKLEISLPRQDSWAKLDPLHRTSPPWYLRWPQPVIDLVRGNGNPRWFCMPQTVEEATEFRPRRVYGAYCGAPQGVRCRCGAQLDGHDPGDEQ